MGCASGAYAPPPHGQTWSSTCIMRQPRYFSLEAWSCCTRGCIIADTLSNFFKFSMFPVERSNFDCDYFLTGKRKIVTFDTKKEHFSLMFQTMNMTKTRQIASILFKRSRGRYPDPHSVRSTMTGHRYHTYNYFIYSIIPSDYLIMTMTTTTGFTSSQNAPPIRNPGYWFELFV